MIKDNGEIEKNNKKVSFNEEKQLTKNGERTIRKNLFNICKAIGARILFICHSSLSIYWTSNVKNSYYYWFLSASLLFLIIELIIVIKVKKGEDWKWFCPSVFVYLTTIISCVWILELDKLDQKPQLTNATGVYIPGIGQQFNTSDWYLMIEQGLMLILIVGRWLLPKGHMTRDELSQLLLVYFAIAADILDFFPIIAIDELKKEKRMIYSILAAWSWSLMQFTFVLTNRATLSGTIIRKRSVLASKAVKRYHVCCETEVWTLLVSVLMQDGPFVILRLVTVIYFKVQTFTIFFFLSKNLVVLVLQFYRIVVLCFEKSSHVSPKMTEVQQQNQMERQFEL
ncbi:unnamed protein product [Dimorphilus gyrociliatus]|uniref:Uncharacterized protein n=1 Tax=Dimorphilus gyrociliatus TaxID=2664684 RepID=A0A7I8W4F6_9ANNE|nr:unnamed protein product [Dimorphilus gyrociliatus]